MIQGLPKATASQIDVRPDGSLRPGTGFVMIMTALQSAVALATFHNRRYYVPT